MQKSASYFDAKLQRVVHPAINKEKKMSEEIENGASPKKRNVGANIKIFFVNDKGEDFNSPAENTTKVKAFLPKTGETEELDLTALKPDMLLRLAAFGASVLGRNEVNTTPEEDGAEQAADNLRGRWEGFRIGSYRSTSAGGGTPLILLAYERALKNFIHPQSGETLSAETIEAKVNSWRAKYDEGEDEAAQKKSRAFVTKELRKSPEVRAAFEAIQNERRIAREEKAPQVNIADL